MSDLSSAAVVAVFISYLSNIGGHTWSSGGLQPDAAIPNPKWKYLARDACPGFNAQHYMALLILDQLKHLSLLCLPSFSAVYLYMCVDMDINIWHIPEV